MMVDVIVSCAVEPAPAGDMSPESAWVDPARTPGASTAAT